MGINNHYSVLGWGESRCCYGLSKSVVMYIWTRGIVAVVNRKTVRWIRGSKRKVEAGAGMRGGSSRDGCKETDMFVAACGEG